MGGQTSQFFCELLNNNFRNSDAEKKVCVGASFGTQLREGHHRNFSNKN